MTEDKDFKTLIQERFAKLPKAVQSAILSGNPEKRLRELSKERQLHLDQWQILEDLVMLTLIGVYHSEDLEKHVREDIGWQPDTARAVAEDITKVVFEPIREELERELEHPQAKAENKSDVERVRESTIAIQKTEAAKQEVGDGQQYQATITTRPATSPQLKATIKVERAPVSPSYKPRELSSERKDVDGDPYREQPA